MLVPCKQDSAGKLVRKSHSDSLDLLEDIMLEEIDAATANATKKENKLTKKESDQAMEIMNAAGRISGHRSPSVDDNDFEKLISKFEEDSNVVDAMKKLSDKLEDSWGSLDDGGASDITSPESKLTAKTANHN